MYADIILDIAHTNVDKTFTYHIPENLNVGIGQHVFVPFGRSSTKKEGFVLSLKTEVQSDYPIKDIVSVIEPYPILLPDQIDLAYWIQKNYHCLLVEALRLMIPSQLRGGKIKEKTEKIYSLSSNHSLEEWIGSLMGKSGNPRSPKQIAVLELFHDSKMLPLSAILSAVPNASAALKSLVDHKILTVANRVSFRKPNYSYLEPKSIHLNDKQKHVVDTVTSCISQQRNNVFLLHGVTGSGKTEVYMHCIEYCLSLGKSAVMLVPEISLTPQTVGHFQARFGNKIAVLHSRLSAGERFDEWRRIRLGDAKVVVGARSAIFAPISDLGLIVIDEEHEGSYQSESSPRYHATEIAQHRINSFHVPLLLGSATPSLTSYFRAKSGRYTLLELPERVMNRPMPDVEIVDMREEFLSGNNSIYSARLTDLLSECLNNGHQAMLFLNRRGYSTFISCRACGSVIQCPNCDLSMTYHKQENRMRCHFCGESLPVPTSCPECKKPFIKYFGIGTEQVEEELHKLFPDVVSLRMDADTMTKKDSYNETLSAFSSGKAQVLIGTQMIAKGHDFPNVTLAGVIAADSSLRIPDYRSTERTFQLLTQISGRAGRDENPGHVVIQTYSPNHPAIQFAKEHNYQEFFTYELNERKKGIFPPYSIFIRFLFSGTDEKILYDTGEQYGKHLEEAIRSFLGKEGQSDLLLLNCSPAPIKKKQGLYRYQILIKLLRTKRSSDVLHMIYDYESAHKNEMFALLEVNPQDML